MLKYPQFLLEVVSIAVWHANAMKDGTIDVEEAKQGITKVFKHVPAEVVEYATLPETLNAVESTYKHMPGTIEMVNAWLPLFKKDEPVS